MLIIASTFIMAKEPKKALTTFLKNNQNRYSEVDPTKNWASVSNGIPFTTLGGQNFNIGCISIVDSKIAWAFAYTPGTGGTRTANRVLRTTDGVSWIEVGSVKVGTAQKHYVMSMLALNKDTCIVVTGPMSGNGEILRTTNGGATWAVVHTATGAWFNVVDKQNDGTIWAQSDPTDDKFYLVKSTDKGATWTRTGLNQPTLISGEAGWANYWYSDGQTIWFPTGKNRIFKSTNGIDGPWTASQPLANITGDPDANIGPIAFSPKNPNIGFVGYQGDNELYKTTDGGSTFFQSIPCPDSILDLRFLPNSNRLYAGTLDGISVSDNGGDFWAADSIEYFYRIPILTLRFYDSLTAFGGGVSGYIIKYVPSKEPTSIILQVDMGNAVKTGNFNPTTDALVVMGDFTQDAELGDNWSHMQQLERRLSTSSKDTVYTYTLQLKRNLVGKSYKLRYSIIKPQSTIHSKDTLTFFVSSATYALPKYKFYFNTTGIQDIYLKATNFELNQNYPNPFNPSTNITFSIPQRAFVTLKIYNSLGQEITTLIKDELNQGTYKVNFDASNLPSGIYFYQLNALGNSITKKMILSK